MGYVLGKNSTKNLHTLGKSGNEKSLLLIELVKGFIRVSPMDFCILPLGGFRTAEEQNSLFKNDPPRSKCDGYIFVSEHQNGLAVDLVPWVKGKPTWDQRQCDFLAGAFKTYCNIQGIEIVSGADWNGDGDLTDGWDACHVQLA